MNTELDQKLCSKYPKMFRDRHAPMTETAMCWGFECGDGWYNIIDQLCGNIQHHIDWREKNNQSDLDYNLMIAEANNGNMAPIEQYYKGWLSAESYIQESIKKGPRDVRPDITQVIVTQVKEKFGTLRFYYDGGDDVIDGMVRMAEAMSAVTGEECGVPGEQRQGGWIRTLCDEHEAAYQARFQGDQ